MISLSHSRLSDLSCPYRFRAIYVDKTHTPSESQAMLIGSAVHAALARYRTHCLESGVDSDVEFWDKLVAEAADDEVRKILISIRKSNAITLARDCDWWGVEMRMGFRIDSDGHLQRCDWRDGACAFRGIVDFAFRVGDTLYVIDDKTGQAPDSADQILTYLALLLIHEPSLRPQYVEGGYWMHARHPRYLSVLSASIDEVREKLDRLETWIVDKIVEVNERTEWPAVPGTTCKWCEIQDCPARTAAIQAHTDAVSPPTEIVTREDAVRAAQFINVIDGLVKNVRERLRAWVEENGPVQTPFGVAEIRRYEGWECTDPYALVRMLAGYGLPVSDVLRSMSISKTALEKLMKRSGKQAAIGIVLKSTGEPTESERFGIYKSTKDDPNF